MNREVLAARRPFSVVALSGWSIGGVQARRVTDWHVVDRRGRTVRVYAAREGVGERIRLQRAGRYARRLNGTVGAMGSWRGGHRWYCRLCGAQIVGPGRV